MKTRFYLLFILLLFLVPVSGCGRQKEATADQAPVAGATKQAGSIFKSLSPPESAALLRSKPNVLILDVRGPDELRQGRLAGSVLTPFWELAAGKHNIPRDRPILVVCAVGGRSLAVGQALATSGYPEVYNLKGGLSAWKAAGLPVQN